MLHRLSVLFLVALPLVPCARAAGSDVADTKKASKLCRQADESLRAGKIDEGRALFQKALEIAPGFPDAHVGLGQMAMVEKRYEDAVKEFDLAEDGYRQFVKDLIDRVQRSENRRQREMLDLADSINQIQSVGSKAGGNPLDQSKIYNQAQRLATNSGGGSGYPTQQDLAPPMGQIYFYRANALFRLGRLPDAIAYYEASIELAPKHLPAYTNLAVAYHKTGRRDDALATVAKAEAQGLQVDAKLKADLGAAK